MIYSKKTRVMVDAMIDRLGGLEGVKRYLDGEITMVEVYKKVSNFISSTFKVIIYEKLTLEELAKKGKFGWITGNFDDRYFSEVIKAKQKHKKKIAIFHFNKKMLSPAIIAEMNRVGFRPATPRELLCLAITKPDLHRLFPVVALGYICNIRRIQLVVCICERFGRSNLSFRHYIRCWPVGYRFAAVQI